MKPTQRISRLLIAALAWAAGTALAQGVRVCVGGEE